MSLAEIAQQDRGGEVALFSFFFSFLSLLENVAAMLRRKLGRQTRAKDAVRTDGRPNGETVKTEE